MGKNNTKKIVLTGIFAALTCIATFIHIPTFSTMGYVNLGDCFVISSGWFLGPLWGAAAAGIGSMLTDLFLGYAMYAPGTLIIKALMAVAAALIYRTMKKVDKNGIAAKITAAVAAELIMAGGYFIYEAYVLGYGAVTALTSMPGNLVQGVAGIIAAILVSAILDRINLLK